MNVGSGPGGRNGQRKNNTGRTFRQNPLQTEAHKKNGLDLSGKSVFVYILTICDAVYLPVVLNSILERRFRFCTVKRMVIVPSTHAMAMALPKRKLV